MPDSQLQEPKSVLSRARTAAKFLHRAATLSLAQAAGQPSELRSLQPDFQPAQHRAYVDHLNAAIGVDGMRNIALTGRYGAGKSSVLIEFARQNKGRVLFLSLSTLGPGSVEESRTNQIQKELVKQLLHREKPGRLPQSRYQRIDQLPRSRAAIDAALALGAVALVLWLFGAFPPIPVLDSDRPLALRILAGTLGVISVVSTLTWIRLAVHNRLVVSEVSAAGAAITLAKKSETYFDQYLDEIVYFFETMRRIDIVVFEDLDRFDEPGIFEALRELNTLLNNSKQSTSRSLWSRQPRTIRFVYALRDSIFEQLGHDTKKLAESDAATAEAQRANRTKFFDLVIPIVPFITHRTARELLSRLLQDPTRGAVPVVPDSLVDLVARHTPDMRLLQNIRNEYSVFARRLIDEKHGMHTLTAGQLFAMVVYKNVHLADFERMLLGRSTLDKVYQLSRDLVTENTAAKRARLRRVQDGIALREELDEKAIRWGERLDWFFAKAVGAAYQGALTGYSTDGEPLDEPTSSVAFWQKVLHINKGVTASIQSQPYSSFAQVSLNMSELQRIVGDRAGFEGFAEGSQVNLLAEEAKLTDELALLRTADFKQLVARPDLKLQGTDPSAEASSMLSLLEEHIDSELARALICEGHIDRYYSLYVGQFYGHRVPANAMNFIVQNVDQNRPDVNYVFESESEIEAVLRETRSSFLSDVSAYNIGLLDYLLEHAEQGAQEILDRVVREVGEPEQAFLDAYLLEGSKAASAVAYLAPRLTSIFTQLIENAELPERTRIKLVDVAAAHSSRGLSYSIGPTVYDFFTSHYASMPTLAAPLPSGDEPTDSAAEPTQDEIQSAVVIFSDIAGGFESLTPLRPKAVQVAVSIDCYLVTAENLRVALGNPPTLSLDTICNRNSDVYNVVVNNAEAYVAAIRSDVDAEGPSEGQATRTPYSIGNPGMFPSIVATLGEVPAECLDEILGLAHPDCMLESIAGEVVPIPTWLPLAAHGLFRVNLDNIDAYLTHLGALDENMANLLQKAQRIEAPAPPARDASEEERDQAASAEEAKVRIAECILNAPSQIPDAKLRAELAGSLNMLAWLPVSRVPAEHGPLLGELIQARVCADAEETFAHFDANHWPTIRGGIRASQNFFEFVSAAVLGPVAVAGLLEDRGTPRQWKKQVLDRFDELVPEGDSSAARAAGVAAMSLGYSLDVEQLTRIATATEDGDFAMSLVHFYGGALTGQEVIDVLLLARPPYAYLSSTGQVLEFPSDTKHKAILTRLQTEGLLSCEVIAKSRNRPAFLKVTVH